MKKRMTLKEFKEVFESTSMCFEYWGWEGILNLISIAEKQLAEECYRNGCPRIAHERQMDADIIYDALERIGYYDYRKEEVY